MWCFLVEKHGNADTSWVVTDQLSPQSSGSSGSDLSRRLRRTQCRRRATLVTPYVAVNLYRVRITKGAQMARFHK